ncbi:metallophosphoesterase [Halorutilales archaeon Cl-col2-1]
MRIGDVEVEFYNDSVYLPETQTVGVSDLHVGREAEAHDEGVSMPLYESETLEDKLRDVLAEFEPETVVFNGDVLHSFGKIRDNAETVERLAAVVESYDSESVFVEGNHDSMLDSVVETRRFYEADSGVVFTHGDTIPADLPPADLYVVGHDHPTVEIEMEKTNCYIYGDFESSKVLMLPAFSPLFSGVAINEMSSADLMSPFVRNLDEFQVAVEKEKGEVLEFPRLREFRRML